MTEKNNKIEKIKKLVKDLRIKYEKDPNIEAIGWGSAQRKGKLEDGICILFFVKQKFPSEKSITSCGSSEIPSEIEGFKTDVQSVKLFPISAGDRDEIKYDPLRGGVATSNSENNILWFNGSGTLGILARDNVNGAAVALSNWHVWGDGGEEGDQIIQPGHPTTGDHLEAIGKIAACGPLLTSLIEWEVPSALTLALYGGAAAAAVAAALSDYRDPNRRGQDKTPTDPGELTKREMLDVEIDYQQLPLPGVPFSSNVNWHYQRETSNRILEHKVKEGKTNTQFLLGKMVVTDKNGYQPGEKIKLISAIWDYQPRPCNGYHVIAHLIPHNNPETALRVVLHPTVCPRKFPHDPPDNSKNANCVTFEKQKLGEYLYKGSFDWLNYLNPGQTPIYMVNWFQSTHALQIPQQSLELTHEPSQKVTAKTAQFTDTPITIIAYDAIGQIVDQKTTPQQQGILHELVLSGEGIVRVIIRGGGGEGILISYCIEPIKNSEFNIKINESISSKIREENPELRINDNKFKSQRCCFTGEIHLPPDEKPGKWDVYLTVQNINPVPENTPPEQAATTIGGHMLSSHTSAEILGCAVIMSLDHVFDVI